MLKVTLTAEDKFALLMGMGANDVLLPRQLITKADFPDAPDAALDKPALIPYGDLSVTSSATTPPVLTGTASLGAYQSSGQWINGYGPMASLASPPTSVNASAAAGGTLSASVPNSEYGIVVTAVDVNGIESDPYPYYTDVDGGGARGSFPSFVPKATVDGTKKINVSWSGALGAAKYHVYLGYYYYGFRPTQRIETTASSCSFTTGPAWAGGFGQAETNDNITPGATVQNHSEFWYWAVSAIMADGETGLSAVAYGINRMYRRPIRIEWLAVTGATGYRLYKRGASGGYIYRFDVGVVTYMDDDLTNVGAVSIDGLPQPAGLLPAPFVGMRTDVSGFSWYAFMVAGCAIKSIENVYWAGAKVDSGKFGVTWAVPGKAGFSTYFGSNTYVDINGHRYTLLYVRGPDGLAASGAEDPSPGAHTHSVTTDSSTHTHTTTSTPTTVTSTAITVTVKGIESGGDGTGTLLTDLADQYKHWLRNFALRDRSTVSPWDTTGPMWNDTPNDVDLVDAASFDAAKAVWALRSPGQCPGAWVMGLSEAGELEQQSARVWAARLNQSLDVFCGFTRKSQYAVKIVNEMADLSATPRYTATLGINTGSFKVEDKPEAMENQITTRYSLDAPHKLWNQILTEDTNAQAAIGEVKPYTLSLWCVRRADVASEIARRRLARRKFPYRIVTWASDMGALTVDLGDIVRISHPDGPAAGGWTDRACFILRHEFDPQQFLITLEALDLDAVIAQVSAQVVLTGAGIISVVAVAPMAVSTLPASPAGGALGLVGIAPTIVVA